MQNHKLERLNNAFMEQLNIIFGTEVKNEILKSVVVTAVNITNDLSYAYIYVSILGGDEESTLLGLKSAVNFIRREVSRSVKLRHTPQIIFKVDDSIKNGMYMDFVP